MERPRIQIDDYGNSREMTDEELEEYRNLKPHEESPEP